MPIQCRFKICFGIPDLSIDTSSINEFQTLGMESSVAKVQGLENQSLCQKLKSFIGYRFIDVYQIHLRIPDSSTDSGFPDLRCFDRFQINSLILDLSLDSRLVVIFLKGRALLYILALRAVCAFIPLQGSTHFPYRAVHSSFTGQYTVPLLGSTQFLHRVVYSSYNTGQNTFLYRAEHSSYTGQYTVPFKRLTHQAVLVQECSTPFNENHKKSQLKYIIIIEYKVQCRLLLLF